MTRRTSHKKQNESPKRAAGFSPCGRSRSLKPSTRTLLVPLAVFLAALTPAQALDPPVNALLVGHWDEYNGRYADIWGDGDFAYIPNWTTQDNQEAQVHVLDISDRAHPVLDETLFIPAPNNFASPQDVKVGDGLLFVALEADNNDGVAIYDVRDPDNRRLLTYVTVPNFLSIHNVFYADGYLYIPELRSIAIIDLTNFDPDNPPITDIVTAKWILNDVGVSFVHDVTVTGGRLYAAAWDSGLWVYDVTDVANTAPTFLGSVAGDNTHSMWPTADGKYVVTGEERTGGGIQVFEMIDDGGSLTLELRDSFTYPPAEAFSVHNQVVVGHRLYNSWYQKGLQVFDIDPDTGELTFVASYDLSDVSIANWGVYPLLGGDRVLLSDTTDGCFIVAVDQPLVPTASQWGLIVLTLLLLTAGTVLFRQPVQNVRAEPAPRLGCSKKISITLDVR